MKYAIGVLGILFATLRPAAGGEVMPIKALPSGRPITSAACRSGFTLRPRSRPAICLGRCSRGRPSRR